MHINDIEKAEDFEHQGITLDGNVEFYITISENVFVGDFFIKKISSMQEAYIESLELESNVLEEAIAEAQEYIVM